MTDAISRSSSSPYTSVSGDDSRDDERACTSRASTTSSKAPASYDVDPSTLVSSSYKPPMPASAKKSAPPPSQASNDGALMKVRVATPSMSATTTGNRLTSESVKQVTDDALDARALELRARLSKTDGRGRDGDSRELAIVEQDLMRRETAKSEAERTAHGGVKLCKRVADLPLSTLHKADHWWLETTRKSVGMGPATGTVPGHGESLPEDFDTKLIDHGLEPRVDCVAVSPLVSEDCVDRELQLDERTGTWVPLLNDCHTVVKRVLERCEAEGLRDVMDWDARQEPAHER
jgi:hypothetical protein